MHLRLAFALFTFINNSSFSTIAGSPFEEPKQIASSQIDLPNPQYPLQLWIREAFSKVS